MTTILAYIAYLLISIGLTVWVARTLHKNGRIFLVEAFRGNEALADSVNHLLVVGFYLVNIGYVALALQFGDKPHTLENAIEYLSTKIGLVLLVLGVMHFLNLAVFARARNSMRWHENASGNSAMTPPTEPLRDAVRRTREGFGEV